MSHGQCKESMHSSKNQQFFKIILDETLKDKSLLIPKKFARIYGETLSDNVRIMLPCGSHWEMELTKHGGSVWLTRGWPEFAKHYSIARGHMLVFHYKGNSKFHVVIFDMTTVEIDYYPKINFEKHNIVDIDDSIEVCDDTNPRKRVRTSHDLEIKEKHELHQKMPLDMSVEMSGIEKAYRPTFKVVMNSTYISRLSLPTLFVTKYLKNKSGNTILKVCGNTSTNWSTKYTCNVYNGTLVARLGQGWQTFVRDNNLQEGDVCVFVLLEGKMVAFEVEIFRGDKVTKMNEPLDIKREESESDSDSDSDSDANLGIETCVASLKSKDCIGDLEKARILERAHFVSKKPFFKVVMQPSYICSSHMNVPSHIAKRYIKKNKEINLCDQNSRSWSVKCKYLKRGSQFSRGWLSFVKDNSLELGDVCIFELIDETKISFKVSIVRLLNDQGNSGRNLPAKRAKGHLGNFGRKNLKCLPAPVGRIRKL